MQKLLNYKPLNLYSSDLLICCNLCCRDPIKHIVKTKFHIRNDDLIAHNYSSFKNLVKNNLNYIKSYAYKIINTQEKMLVNRYIYITDPKTNKKTKFSSTTKISYNTNKIIEKNQKFLINKIFN